MSIEISQLKDHSISVNQDICATSSVAKYLYTATIKEDSKFHENNLRNNMIFTKEDASNSDEEVDVLYR